MHLNVQVRLETRKSYLHIYSHQCCFDWLTPCHFIEKCARQKIPIAINRSKIIHTSSKCLCREFRWIFMNEANTVRWYIIYGAIIYIKYLQNIQKHSLISELKWIVSERLHLLKTTHFDSVFIQVIQTYYDCSVPISFVWRNTYSIFSEITDIHGQIALSWIIIKTSILYEKKNRLFSWVNACFQ